MAAPVLQTEGGLNIETTGDNSPTIPTHQADDILIACSGFWGPNSDTLTNPLTPTSASGWTEIASVYPIPDEDGIIQWFWHRATAAGTTVSFRRPNVIEEDAGPWDTGTDTCWGVRVYVIRGCITTGDPWDEADPTSAWTFENQPVDAVTVSGNERLVMQFLVKTDDYVTAPTITTGGWSSGSAVESATGTNHSQRSFWLDDRSTSTSADSTSVEAPAAGFYAFLGVSFKPPTGFDATQASGAFQPAPVDQQIGWVE